MERIVISDYVATLYRDGEPVGEWQAGSREYAAAGLPWPGCTCGDDECRHGLAHYWGETLSPVELDALAGASVAAIGNDPVMAFGEGAEIVEVES